MKNKKHNQLRSEKNAKSKTLRVISIIAVALFVGSAVTWGWLNQWDIEKSYQRAEIAVTKVIQQMTGSAIEEQGEIQGNPDLPTANVEELTPEEATEYIEGQELPANPTYVDDILIANKRNPLPSTFAPGESVAAREAFNEMAAAAALEGYLLVAFSTYRSFDRQVELYDKYVARDGVEEADRYSARPGYSEHQTGMAFDIGETNQEQHWASTSFGETEAGKWIAENAHLYGFVMRYPEGKEQITGYMYEAWHFRYVGVDISKVIYNKNETLEEYLGL